MIRGFGADLTNELRPATTAKAAPLVISVEAAIGAGKSSLLNVLKEKKPEWDFVQEPVELWQTVGGEHNLLEAFYGNPERYAFSFQTHCVLTRMEVVGKALAKSHAPVIILERSWISDRHTFAEMLAERKAISDMEWALYDHWYNYLVRVAPPIHGHVYMECNTEMCMSRLRKRSRKEEVGVTDEYQQKLIEKHENWLETVPADKVCRLNVEKDFLHTPGQADIVVAAVESFVQDLLSQRH